MSPLEVQLRLKILVAVFSDVKPFSRALNMTSYPATLQVYMTMHFFKY